MIPKLTVAVACMIAVSVVVPSLAQEVPGPGRYAMKDVEDGLIRLDTQTGQVSHCRKKTTDWVCETVADERKAYQDEITRLSRENEELRSRIAQAAESAGKSFPGDEELEQVMAFMEKFMRRFFEFAKSMRDQLATEI